MLRPLVFLLSSVLLSAVCAADLGAQAGGGGESPVLSFAPEPGVYRSNVRLEISSSVDDGEIRFTYRDSPGETFQPYDFPLTLSALTGEERGYDLHVQLVREGIVVAAQRVSYRIDKRPPPSPGFDPTPGIYYENLVLTFQSSPDADVVYTLSDPVTSLTKRWDGFGLELTAEPGERRDFVVEAYGIDGAGNQSPLVTRRYTVDRTAESVQGRRFEVLSPVPGEFANPQLLYVDVANARWVRYAFNQADPVTEGVEYSGPVRIDGEGRILVRVAASFDRDEDPEYREVLFSQGSAPADIVERDPLTGTVRVTPPEDSPIRYTTDERRPGDFDPLLTGVLTLEPQRGSLRYLSFRWIEATGAAPTQYRTFHVLDGRVPSEPAVTLLSGLPFRDSAEVVLRTTRDSATYYTTDGSEPDILSPRYEGGALSLDMPEGSGTFVFSARSRFANGNWGPTAREEFPYDSLPPEPPEVRVIRESVVGSVEIELAGSGEDFFVYTLTDDGSDPPPPSAEDPVIQSPFVLTAPYGYEGLFSMRFAAVDAAGNVSTAGEIYRFLIDKASPPEPQLLVDENEVRLDGEGELFYRLIGTGADATDFSPYDGPVTLPGQDNRRVEYRVEAYAADEHGNRSPLVESAVLVVDRRIPEIPQITGISDGAVVSDEQVVIGLPGRPPELRVHYEISRWPTSQGPPEGGAETPVATRRSPEVGASIELQVDDGADESFHLSLLPVYAGAERDGSPVELRFRIDRRAPDLPDVLGIQNGSVYSGDVRIGFSEIAEDVQVYVLLGDAASVSEPDPLAEGFVYTSSLVADAAPGEETEYILAYAARDSAGNVTRGAENLRFVVDRAPPAAPVVVAYGVQPEGAEGDALTIDPPGPVSTAVRVEIRAEDAAGISYALTNDGSIPRDPKISYNGPFVLEGRDSQETEYNLLAVARDRAGNESPQAELFTVVVDRIPPPDPPEPSIRFADNRLRDSGTLTWRLLPDTQLYFRIGDTEFERYQGPTRWSIPDDSDELRVQFFNMDPAGNVSETLEYLIVAPARVPEPTLLGVVDGGLYSSEVALRNETPGNLIVRYELTTGGANPPEVTRFSPILGGLTRFEANAGETVRYRLVTRAFASDGSASVPVGLDFTIDRNPPRPPTLAGAEDRGFYQEDVTVSLQAQEGAVFVSVRRREAGQTPDAAPKFEEYSGPISLRSEAGAFASYVIEAFTLDAAGNQSPQIARWEIFIDREIIYVSPDGRDDSAGSRSEPFATLGRALEEASQGDRRTIFLRSGTFSLDEPVSAGGNLSIIGGFGADWRITEDTMQRSILRRSPRFTEKRALVSLAEGRLELQRLDLSDEESHFDAVLVVEGGELVLSHGDIRVSQTTLAVSQQGGSTVLHDVTLQGDRSVAGSLVRAVAGSLEVRDSLLESRNAVADMTLINALSTDLVSLHRSTLIPGSGASTRALYVVGGELVVEDTYVNSGFGRTSAQAIVVDSAVGRITNSRLTGSDDAPLSVVLSMDGSDLRVSGTRFEAAAGRGATAVSARASVLEFTGNTVVGSPTGEFIYLMNLRETEGVFRQNLFQGSDTGDFIAAILRASRTSWQENRIEAGRGRSFTAAFHVTEDGQTVVENNDLRHDRLVGSALYVGSTVQDLQITENSFYGWHVLLEEETGLPSNWRTEMPLTQTIDTPEKLNARDGNRPGFVIRGNTSEVFVNSN